MGDCNYFDNMVEHRIFTRCIMAKKVVDCGTMSCTLYDLGYDSWVSSVVFIFIQLKAKFELTKVKKDCNLRYIRGSSNGRTTVFGAVYRGSNPCPRTTQFFIPANAAFFVSKLWLLLILHFQIHGIPVSLDTSLSSF